MHRTLASIATLLCALAAANCASAPSRWYKGNLHTHSLWSDGIEYPEAIAAWYRDNGYNFLGLTEHDMLQEGDKWVDINAPDPGWPPRNKSAREALPHYLERFGNDWVQQRDDGSKHLVRLRPLSEYRHLLEQPGRFLLIMGEEITDKGGAHMNAFNLATAILPRGGADTGERTRNNLAAVEEQRRATGRNILAVVNHPNYVWALTADQLAASDARFFEVYNGHRLTNSMGDSAHISTERMWDLVLNQRLAAGRPLIFGVANDDAHDYGPTSDTISRPGRAWNMVRAKSLTLDALLDAIQRGDFYASTGVTLAELRTDKNGIRIRIAPEPGVTFRTVFIGARGGGADTLKSVTGLNADYRFDGTERYVRAKIMSSKNTFALTQPVVR